MNNDFSEESFSQKQISQKVNAGILSNSLTLYPTALGALALLWGALFGVTTAFIIGVAALALGVGNYVFQRKMKFEKLATKHIDQLRDSQKKELIGKLSTLGDDLSRLGCQQGVEQVSHLEKKFNTLCQMIAEKLAHDPVKASRLTALAEQLYLATIVNLLNAKQMLKSIDDIDLEYIDTQLARAHNDMERESLEERKNLKLNGLNAVEECIAKNEVAMTKINQLAIQLAQTKNAQFKMEESLHEITNNVRVEQWEME